MKIYKIDEVEVKIPTEWKDITFERYMKIAKLEQSRKSFPIQELYLLKLIETICGAEEGERDELNLEDVNSISNDLAFLSNNSDFKVQSHIKIGEVDYVFPKDLNRLTMGEYISIKTIQEKIGDDVEMLPWILAIILRPGKLIIDKETGKEIWKQNKFDAENLEYRRELFMKESVENLIGAVNFFLSGNKTFINNSKDYMEEELKLNH